MSVNGDVRVDPVNIRGDINVALRGEDGLSAYEVAVKNGFSGTEEEWLESLKGEAAAAEAYTNEAKEYWQNAQASAIQSGNSAVEAARYRNEAQDIRDAFAPEVADARAAIQAEKEEAEQKKLLVDDAAANAHLDREQADADAAEVRYLYNETIFQKNVATDAAERARLYAQGAGGYASEAQQHSQEAEGFAQQAQAREEQCTVLWENMKTFPDTARLYMEEAGRSATLASQEADKAHSSAVLASQEAYQAGQIKLDMLDYGKTLRQDMDACESRTEGYSIQAKEYADLAGASAEMVQNKIDTSVAEAVTEQLAGKLDVNGKAVDSAHADNADEATHADSADDALHADNADTVNGHTVETSVPPNAVFTDTTYEVMDSSELEDGVSTQGRLIDAHTLATFILTVAADVVNNAPEALDTLAELAQALGDDPNFATTVMNAIGQKLDKAGGVVTGDLAVNGTLTADVTGNADTATKLATARTINIQDSTATNTGTGASFDGSGNATIKLPATIKANITGNVSGSSGSCTGNSETATKLATARTINIQDSSATNTGTGASFDGSGNATIKLPATIKANITGNCSGSSGSCTGNAATATSAAACTGNAATATKLATARTLWGASFDGSGNVSGNMSSVGSITYSDTAADATKNLLYAKMGANDYFRVLVGGASNAGYAEIATADDGNEPIYVRQYSGTFATLTRTATILDGSGNTTFPGKVTASGGFAGALTGNVTGNCSGSSGSCTGNAATATKATGDKNGKDIAATYLPLAGGTMTGPLTLTNSQPVTAKQTNITRGTSTTAAYPFAFKLTDNANNTLGGLYYEYLADKTARSHLVCYQGTTNANKRSSIGIGYNNAGNPFTWAPTPADNNNTTEIATTAWVQNFCDTTKKYLTAHQSLSNYLTRTTNVSEMGRYIDMHFDNATQKFDYDVRLQVNNQGTAAGQGVLQVLGASVKATKFEGPLTGNVTGNCSGSSGSCTGNAATATKIKDKTIPVVSSFNSSTGVLALTSLS